MALPLDLVAADMIVVAVNDDDDLKCRTMLLGENPETVACNTANMMTTVKIVMMAQL